MASFKLFPYLRQKCDKTSLIASSRARAFYEDNSEGFVKYPALNKYASTSDPFSLIKADIILEGVNNKEEIEKSVELYQKADLTKASIKEAIHQRMASCLYKGKNIYVPFLSPLVNQAYNKNFSLLLHPPFSFLKKDFDEEIIDPFDTYGFDLFSSSFTDLVEIATSKEENLKAYYDIDFETIFVIDDQGRMEEEIRLFDAPDPLRSKTHLISKLEALMAFYFASDKESFIDSLYNFSLITLKTYQFIVAEEEKKNALGLS